MMLLCDEDGRYLSELPLLKMPEPPWFSVMMLPVDIMFLEWLPEPLARSKALLGVDLELSFRTV